MLFNITMVFVLLSVVFFGIVFLTIHSLPERLAHKSKKVQLDIVAVLCLLALFSHEHVFWVAALLLAFIDIPDFSTPFKRMVTAVETIAEQQAGSTPPADESDSAPPKAVPAEKPRQIQKGSAHA
ncbi:MAG: hypothetical protein ACXU8R_11935 [Xanthobacteraceae bacterium]